MIEHWNTERDGPLNERQFREKLVSRGYGVSTYTYMPGTEFPDHLHGVDKIDAVLAGRFEIVLEGKAYVLEPGDCLAVPRGARHSARVLGNEPVLSLDAIRSRGEGEPE